MDDQIISERITLAGGAVHDLPDVIAFDGRNALVGQRHDVCGTIGADPVLHGVELPEAGLTIVVGACRVVARAVTQGRPFYVITPA